MTSLYEAGLWNIFIEKVDFIFFAPRLQTCLLTLQILPYSIKNWV